MSQETRILWPVAVPEGRDPETVCEYLWWCPGCKCAHYVNVTRGKVRWDFDGNLEAPTFRPSILVHGETWVPQVTAENCEQYKKQPWEQRRVAQRCHTFIRGGMIEYLSDCTHELAGQTVPMVKF